MRVAIHDDAGHPSQFDLSCALAPLGHAVRHCNFADDPGPKGDRDARSDDPAGFSTEAIFIPLDYSKGRTLQRFLGDGIHAIRRAPHRGLSAADCHLRKFAA